MKIKALVIAVALTATVLTGCAQKAAPAAPAAAAPAAQTETKPAAETKPATETKTDAVTSASQVNDEAAFEKAISKDNSNFMVIVNKDLTFTKDLTVESGVKKDKDGKEAPNRAIAPAAQDANRKIAARYTITAPNVVFAGENEKLEYGIIKGDVYVQSAGFTLADATVDGNLYFATKELKDAFKLDATSKVTGTTDVKAFAK